MSPPTFIILLLLGTICFLVVICYRRRCSNDRKLLPPGPPPLPVIGNLHRLLLQGELPHRTLWKLSKKYGPIMSLRLGSILTIVVSSPEAAQLFLKTHDSVFASRPRVQAPQYLSYGAKGVAFAQYGPYWRSVRKLCTVELMTAGKIGSYKEMRKEETEKAVDSIKAAAAGGLAVDVSEMAQRLVEEMIYRMVFGRRSDESVDLRDSVHEALELMGAFNLSDFFPLLRQFDLQGLTRRMKRVSKRVDEILEKIIAEHEEEAAPEARVGQTNDFTHVLLSLIQQQEEEMNNNKYYSGSSSYNERRNSIKAVLLDMVIGALGSSSLTIEWFMTELLRHPRVMRKIQDEIDTVIGKNRRMADENDLSKLNYLEMVIKETFRLHPPVPLLVPRESMEDIVINGYSIPSKSRILVNYWAITRDPNAWSGNVDEFIPERFSGSEIDFQGQHFQFLPFGAGRRGCPGINLAMTSIRLVLAQLVHCFNWTLPHGMSPDEVDMTEKFSLALPRATHLFAVPTYRL